MKFGRQLPEDLRELQIEMEGYAREYGLDFFPTIFEVLDYDQINQVAAYGGFPVRYPHWRFGMDYERLSKGYTYGLQKIYEMVINTDPSYAYLLDNNLIVDQKLVMAHVLGHVDFFKNNAWFASTNRKMLDQMANHATKVRKLMDKHGTAQVERFIDLCLSMDNLIDPYSPYIQRYRELTGHPEEQAGPTEVKKIKAKGYMDRHINPPEVLETERQRRQAEWDAKKRYPEEPRRDVLGFLLEAAPLERWQRTILEIIRDEAYYFAPQGMTKIMNEGWATYWHTTMMTHDILTDSEVVDYADHHSGTVAMRPGQLNPYRLGLELLRHIEMRWDKGRFGKGWMDCDDPAERRRWDTGAGLGRQKIYEVRRTHNDISFLETFLTADFCREQGFFTTKYDPRAKRWIIDSREFEAIKQQLLQMVSSKGTPRVYVVDANANNRSELLLAHQHEGMDIQLDWAALVLGNLASVWTRPMHLDTLLEGKPIRLTHDGAEIGRTVLKESE